MKFNKDKYEVLHLGKKNQMHKHRMGENCLGSSTAEKVLRVVVDHNHNISQQCDAVAKKQTQFSVALTEAQQASHGRR